CGFAAGGHGGGLGGRVTTHAPTVVVTTSAIPTSATSAARLLDVTAGIRSLSTDRGWSPASKLDTVWVLYDATTTPFDREEHKPLAIRLQAMGQRSETVRRANLSAIVRELHVRGPLSRSDLVARTGLTRSAIRVLIGQLAAAG